MTPATDALASMNILIIYSFERLGLIVATLKNKLGNGVQKVEVSVRKWMWMWGEILIDPIIGGTKAVYYH